MRIASTTNVRSEILDASGDPPAGAARFDHALVARGFPYHWYPAEVEQTPDMWRQPRLSVSG